MVYHYIIWCTIIYKENGEPASTLRFLLAFKPKGLSLSASAHR